MHILIPLFALFTLSFTAFSQEPEPKPIKRISIDDIYIHSGISMSPHLRGNYSDFNALAPQSDILNNNVPNFTSSDARIYSGSTTLSVILGFKFSDKQKSYYKANPVLRIGVSYSPSLNLTGGSYNEKRLPFDTLTSSQTGEAIYLDSITTESYGANYSSDQLSLNASLIFRTNPEVRWSLYSGIGISVGISINASTDVYYNTSINVESISSNGKLNSGIYMHNNTSEFHRNKTNFGFSAYIPIGVDFRIGNKREFWKRTHLFYVFKPAINVVSIPELYTVSTPSIQQGLGLRVTLN